MWWLRLSVATVAAMFAGAGFAQAAVSLNTDPASFLATNPIVLTDDFDDPPTPTVFPPELGAVTRYGITYTHERANPGWTIATPGEPGGSAPNALIPSAAIGETAVSFDGQVAAIGFTLTPLFAWGNFVFRVTEAGGFTTEFAFSDPGSRYYGFSSAVGIISVAVTQPGQAGVFVNYAFDDVSRSLIVPEPGAAVLTLVAGTAALGRIRRPARRRVQQETGGTACRDN